MDKLVKSPPLQGGNYGFEPRWEYKLDNMYICKYCGREFEKQQSYASHTCKCKLKPNRDYLFKHLAYTRSCKKDSREKDLTEYHCQYCGKICIGKNSLVQHEIRCKENPNSLIKNGFISNFIKYNQECRDNIKHHPHKGKTKETCESLRKAHETKKKQIENGTYVKSFLGKKHSNESREKMRNSAIEYLKNCKNFNCPRYNKKSIEYINRLNKEKHWNLQHAENGGELKICGYFLDGYDKELNIVFEYDEPNHYKDVEKSILLDKDIERQNNIIKVLNCKFYRYNEKLDLLYEVTTESLKSLP